MSTQGNVWKFIGKKFENNLKHDYKPFYGGIYRIPHAYISAANKELDRFLEIGVLNIFKTDSEWGAPYFTSSKKNDTVKFINYFRYLNNIIQRNPWPMPNIQYFLDDIGGIQFATVIDLKMG